MKTKARLLAFLLGMAIPAAALAQGTPGFTTGQVPSALQWNSYFAAKQNYFGTPAAIATSGSATDLIAGTVNAARLPSGVFDVAGAAASAITAAETYAANANNLASGTVNAARLPSGVFDVSGAAASAITTAETFAANADNLASGTVAAARLPVGATGVLGILSVDNTTITATAGVIAVKAGVYDASGAAASAITTAATHSDNASNLSSGTVAAARLPLASSSAFGIGEVDNTTIKSTAGVLALVNSSMTIAGHAVALGGTQTLAASDLTNGVSGTGAVCLVSGSACSSAMTVATSPITGGADGGIFYHAGTVLGELSSTGTGNVVRASNAALVSPDLGTPTAINLANATGLPSSALITARNAQVGTTYATLATDAGKLITLTNASPIAVSLSQATTAGFGAGFETEYATTGAGVVTITATTSVFGNGLTALICNPGQACDVESNGTNYPFTSMSLPLVPVNGLLANITAAANYPVPLGLSAYLDAAMGSTRGSILVRGASVWAPLTPGTNGYLLTSAGAGADPSWAVAAGSVSLSAANVWTAQQSNAVTTLTIATSTFTPTGATNNYLIVLTSACPCTIANPSATPVAGTAGTIEVDQDSGGSKTVTWDTQYIAQGGVAAIPISTAGSAKDIYSYQVLDATHILITAGALNATH